MGLFDKIKGFINDPEEDEEEEFDTADDGMDFVSKSEDKAADSSYTAAEPKKNNKVVNIHTTAQLQVVLVKPERFDDASTVADHLNAKRTVVLNLESANKDVARRILDFLSGVAYANDGQIKKVANCTFIITPYNVGIMGDLLDELESNGLYVSARLDDAVQLSEAHSCPRFVGFLDERQRAMAQAQLKAARGVNVSFYGGHDEAERTLCGIFPDFMEPEPALFPLTALAFRFRAEAGLTHRDFLGSLLSCGVKRETVGDILCGDGLAVSFVDENVAPFLCGQLTKVGGEGVTVTAGYTGALPAGRAYAPIRDTVASPRLDAVVKALIGTSREEAARLIAAGLVSLNHLPSLSASAPVREGDCLSVRGKGRYMVDALGPPTRKGRLALSARKCV